MNQPPIDDIILIPVIPLEDRYVDTIMNKIASTPINWVPCKPKIFHSWVVSLPKIRAEIEIQSLEALATSHSTQFSQPYKSPNKGLFLSNWASWEKEIDASQNKPNDPSICHLLIRNRNIAKTINRCDNHQHKAHSRQWFFSLWIFIIQDKASTFYLHFPF